MRASSILLGMWVVISTLYGAPSRAEIADPSQQTVFESHILGRSLAVQILGTDESLKVRNSQPVRAILPKGTKITMLQIDSHVYYGDVVKLKIHLPKFSNTVWVRAFDMMQADLQAESALENYEGPMLAERDLQGSPLVDERDFRMIVHMKAMTKSARRK